MSAKRATLAIFKEDRGSRIEDRRSTIEARRWLSFNPRSSIFDPHSAAMAVGIFFPAASSVFCCDMPPSTLGSGPREAATLPPGLSSRPDTLHRPQNGSRKSRIDNRETRFGLLAILPSRWFGRRPLRSARDLLAETR